MFSPRHKVFVSYHHANDEYDKDEFESLFGYQYDILVSRSVQIGDLHPRLNTDTVRRLIRDEYLSDSTVTVVLIGSDTWRRKHVDWEISASIRHTPSSPRSGLMGIVLPSYPLYSSNEYDPHTIPPRLHYNIECGFAEIYLWNSDPVVVSGWIDEAFRRRKNETPDNSFPLFVNNRKGERWQP